jgi:hypothetical protein
MPEPTDLDLLVSAQLDGELDALVAELGLDADAVRRTLAGTEAAARRADLLAARNALGTATPTLDHVTRRRILRAAADSGAVAAPRSRWPRIAAAAAAAILLLGGIGFLVTRGGSDDSAKSADRSTPSVSVPEGDLGDLGALDQRSVDALVGGSAPASGAPGAGGATPSVAPPAPDLAAGGSDKVATNEAVDRCVTTWSKQGTIRFRAAGSFSGQPAVIIGLATGTRTIVLVIATDNCDTVLYSASR